MGPVTSQTQDDDSSSSPDRFCPGIPGHPGNPGTPGTPGTTGNPGNSGIPGNQGLTGPPGRDGSSITGDAGERGDKGDPGVKGEPGSAGRSRKSAFMAIKTSSQTGDIGEVLTFHEVVTNLNNDFSLATNVFTCFIPGTYSFTLSLSVPINKNPVIRLVKNGDPIVSTYTRTNDEYAVSSNSAIVNLDEGDHVWLQFKHNSVRGNTISSTAIGQTTFSGFLIYEN